MRREPLYNSVMRICLISREYPPETGFGGIATFTKHLAHGLALNGHDVEVVTLAKEQERTYVEAVGESADGGKSITIHRVLPYNFHTGLDCVNMAMPYSRYLICTSSALWRKFAERHAFKPFDAVDTPELLAEGIYPALTKVAPMVVRLYTPHSKFIAEKLHNVRPSFDHQFVAMVERVAMLSCDVITSPSDDLAEFVANDLGIKQESICIVRNPINTAVFSPEGEKALPDPADGKLRVLFVGRLEERKGINYLVAAIPEVIKEFPAVEFVIIGDDTNTAQGQTSVLKGLKETLSQTRTLDKVTFIDRVPLDALPSYYRSADICIVPSVYDNSPYTCLESMSCGRAVIGTSAGGTKEYMIHQESGLIIPARDTGAIKEALLTLLQDPQERARLAQGARKRAVEKFDRCEIARQTAELYKLAQANHRDQTDLKQLYRHQYQQALTDAEDFLNAMDRMLYDMLFQYSYRFRINHWWRHLKARPRFFLCKFLLKALKIAHLPLGKKAVTSSPLIRKLEDKIQEADRLAQSSRNGDH